MLACEMTAIVRQFKYSLVLPFFGVGMKTDFSSLVATAEFSKIAGILRKGAVTPQEIEPDLPVSVQESPLEAWVNSGLL